MCAGAQRHAGVSARLRLSKEKDASAGKRTNSRFQFSDGTLVVFDVRALNILEKKPILRDHFIFRRPRHEGR